MPELGDMMFGVDQHRVMQIWSEDDREWITATLQQLCADGRVRVRYETDPDTDVFLDLSRKRYRWVR
jgi:hypothetical protein